MEKGMNFFLDRYNKLGESVSEIKLRPCLRANTLKVSGSVLKKRLENLGVKLERVPFLDNGYFYSSRFSLGSIAEYLLGYFYLQNAAAQVPVQVLEPKPGEKVLDCCAAPGGKAVQIVQLMQNKGVLIALDKKKQRIAALKSHLERCGVGNCAAYLLDANKAASLGIEFDRVLLDAPCSGNFVSDPAWFRKRSLKGIRKSADMQRSLIKSALSVLKKNGILVYSTCSLEPEENELNMQWMLDHFKVKITDAGIKAGDPGLTSIFGKELDKQVANCRRFWPNKAGTEGFFVARIWKK